MAKKGFTERSPERLGLLLAQAAHGDRESIPSFLEEFLLAEVIVLNRIQKAPLSHQPQYPPLFSLLAVQEQDRVIVPCFLSSVDLIRWGSSPLEFTRVPTKNLLERMPDGWWLVLNPGADASKEFSPWEIATLRAGSQGIAEVVSEITGEGTSGAIEVAALEEHEATSLRSTLIEAAKKEKGVQALYILRETTLTADETQSSMLRVGVLATSITEEEADELRDQFQRLADVQSIGQESVRVTCGQSLEGLTLSAFQVVKPLWQRKPWWKAFGGR